MKLPVLIVSLLFVAGCQAGDELVDIPASELKSESGDPVEYFLHPEKAPARKEGFETADHFWYNEISGIQQWEDPTLNRIDEDGKETWIDPETGKETDTQPAAAGWIFLWDEKEGREYFHNTVTEETTWDLPQILAWQRVNLDSEGNVIMPGEGVASDGDEGDVEGEEYAESDEEGEEGSEEDGEEDPEWDGDEEGEEEEGEEVFQTEPEDEQEERLLRELEEEHADGEEAPQEGPGSEEL